MCAKRSAYSTFHISLYCKYQDINRSCVTCVSGRRVTYSAAAVSDSLRGAACAVSSGRHVGAGWRTRRGFVACTSAARHPEEPSPAQSGSARGRKGHSNISYLRNVLNPMVANYHTFFSMIELHTTHTCATILIQRVFIPHNPSPVAEVCLFITTVSHSK